MQIMAKPMKGSLYEDMKQKIHAEQDGWSMVTFLRDDETDCWCKVFLLYRDHVMGSKMSTIKQLTAKLKNGKGAYSILADWIKEVQRKDKAKIKRQRELANDILAECQELEDLHKKVKS